MADAALIATIISTGAAVLGVGWLMYAHLDKKLERIHDKVVEIDKGAPEIERRMDLIESRASIFEEAHWADVAKTSDLAKVQEELGGRLVKLREQLVSLVDRAHDDAIARDREIHSRLNDVATVVQDMHDNPPPPDIVKVDIGPGSKKRLEERMKERRDRGPLFNWNGDKEDD